MKKTFSRTLWLGLVSCALIFGTSCKEQTAIPGDFIPEIDNIHTFGIDAPFFDPELRVHFFDSLKTSDYTTNIGGVGKLADDPVFGSMTQSLYFQVVPPSTFFRFPQGVTFDSAALYLPYTGISFGSEEAPENNYLYLDVFQVSEPFQRKTEYYAHQTLSYNHQRLGTAKVSLSALKDTLRSPLDTLTNTLRVPLSNNFAQSLLTADESKFLSPSAFLEYFKGFVIRPTDTSGQHRISYLRLSGESTLKSARMSFYFHDTAGRPSVVHFPFDSYSSAYFTSIERSYGSSIASAFVQSDRSVDSVFVQGFPGLFTELTIRNIEQLPASIINKAQLTLTSFAPGLFQLFQPPARLQIHVKDSTGTYQPIADQAGLDGAAQGGAGFVNGRIQHVSISGQPHVQYVLNFPRELQRAMMANQKELTFRISAPSSYPGAYRLFANGFSGQEETKMAIRVIYTKK